MKKSQPNQASGFRELLNNTLLKSIVIEHADCEMVNRDVLNDPSWVISYDFSYEITQLKSTSKQTAVHVHHFLEVNGWQNRSADSTAEPELVAFLGVFYLVEYETPKRMTQKDFESYRAFTLALHTAPLARQWFLSQSTQMGLGPVLMPNSFQHAEVKKRDPEEALKSFNEAKAMLESAGFQATEGNDK